MYRMADDLGRPPGKEITTSSLAMIVTLTSHASTCAASVLDKAGFVFRSCFKSSGQLDDGRCDNHPPCCQSAEDYNAKRVVNLMGGQMVGASWLLLVVGES
jgi:hypothetical protein